jgi:hypothetical protein
MKKIIIPFIAIIALVSCKKEATETLPTEKPIVG